MSSSSARAEQTVHPASQAAFQLAAAGREHPWPLFLLGFLRNLGIPAVTPMAVLVVAGSPR